MNPKNQIIFIVSNEPWGDTWYSKQHYAWELSEMGYLVYFLNPVDNWKFRNLFCFTINSERISKNLFLINYKNNLPQGGRLFKYFTYINDFINCFKIRLRLKHKGAEVIWWKFDPFRFIVGIKSEYKQIYHVVDPYFHLWQNIEHAKRADLIVCTNLKYISFYNKLVTVNVINVPHGVSANEFIIDKTIVEELRSRYGVFALIIGNINHYVDISLLQRLVDNGTRVLSIGKSSMSSCEWNKLKDNQNFYHLGQMHARNLKHYVAASTVGLVTYKVSGEEEDRFVRSPLKVLNYLSQMRPVISTIPTGIVDIEGDGVFIAKNKDTFCELVSKAINQEVTINEGLIKNYLEKNSYKSLINIILEELCSLRNTDE